MRPVDLNRYDARIDRVLDFIVDHVHEPVSLEQLASAASLSPFHFHRVWRAMMGEPIMETVRRTRMALAAHRLASTDTPVTHRAIGRAILVLQK
jgi:AraC-like DNA-binding protein